MSTPVEAFGCILSLWLATALGAASIFVFRDMGPKFLDAAFGVSGGIMASASFWSLLLPSVEMSKNSVEVAWLPPLGGFVIGSAFMYLADRLVPHLHYIPGLPEGTALEKIDRMLLVILALAVHNIPEGLSVGTALGTGTPPVGLTLGIALQDVIEGAISAILLGKIGMNRRRVFWWAQLTGFVEFAFGILGFTVAKLTFPTLSPWLLAFASAAMVYVVVEEVIPEAQSSRNSDIATLGFLLGFSLMIILETVTP